MKISIVGAGSFGTAMAVVAARCGNEVLLWAHDADVAAAIDSGAATRVMEDYIAVSQGFSS